MVKCGSCGKFISSVDCIRCSKCSGAFHRACSGAPDKKSMSAWQCSGCKAKSPRGDNSSTLVRTTTSVLLPENQTSPSSYVMAMDDTANSDTEEVRMELALEIRSFRNELNAMRAELREVHLEITDFKSSLKSCCDRIDTLEERVCTLEEKFDKRASPNFSLLEQTITDLQNQLNDRDQELLISDVEIAGIPEHREESIGHLVSQVVLKLGVNVDESDIVFARRVGMVRRNRIEGQDAAASETQRPRTIAVRLARYALRNEILRAARVRRTFSTADLGVQGTSRRVYVNERLTRTNRQLFFQAREEGRRLHWKFVWTREGRIFARKEEGKPIERIRCASDITRIFGSRPV